MSNKEFIFTATQPTAEIIKWVMVNLQPGRKYVLKKEVYKKRRTLDQNAQSHVWYKQIADELPEDDIQGWSRYCKLHHGVGILRADDTDFRKFYDRAIKSHLKYEEKLQAMDYTPVTRLMNTEQFNKYFEALQTDFRKRGVELKFLNEPPIFV
jgi:hypothetical protein